MQYSSDTLLSVLLEKNAISRQAYNALVFRNMHTLGDVKSGALRLDEAR